jgi:replicative DNA helicase
LAALCDEYIAEERNGKAAGKVGTGIAECDDYFGKLGAGEVLVMAGRPAVGKTALAIQMADSVVRAGGRAMIVSLEMNGKDLVGRIAKQRAGRGSAITRGCSKEEYDAAKESRIRSAEKLKEDAQRLNIFEVAETNSVSRIEDRVAMLASADALPDVVVIDYLQLIQPDDARAAREQQVAAMSRRLKLMALAFRVPVILLSQLNRDAEKNDRRPRLSDLRESGSIEQDADRVWLLYPDPEVPLVADSPTVQVVIDQAKNRNGAGGIAKAVRFFKPAFAFEKL